MITQVDTRIEALAYSLQDLTNAKPGNFLNEIIKNGRVVFENEKTLKECRKNLASGTLNICQSFSRFQKPSLLVL